MVEGKRAVKMATNGRGVQPHSRGSKVFRRRLAVMAEMTAAAAVIVRCATPPAGAPPAATSPAAPASPSVTAPPTSAGSTVHPVTAVELGASWRPGCPVDPGRLRRAEVDYIGFDRQSHRGELIVHQDLVPQVSEIFEQLYRLRYPIEKMRTVDRYPGASDELSMADNNTSAFNCRRIPGSSQWSPHAYGRAIDLNPRLNPFIDSTGAVQPKNAIAYLDRSRTDPGVLHGDDPAVHVFTDRGWRWGGSWPTPVDYQHFELP